MTAEQTQILNKLRFYPYLFGHGVGFTKLTPLNNEWIINMVYGDADYDTLQAHRGSYKTTCVAIALTLILILFPNEKTRFFRKNDTAVKEIIHQVSMMLKHPLTKGIVRVIWGVELKLLTDSAFEITTNLSNDPRGSAQLSSSGIKASMTGQHYDRIFTDDIVTREDRYSRAEREFTIQAYYELINLINPTGRIFNSGTPWHPDDAFSVMPDAKKYDCYSTGILSDDQINERKGRMTASLFAANYELKHIASEDVIFDNPQTGADPVLATQGYAHVDSAYYGEDYTALTILNYHDGQWYVFGRCWRKHVDECKDEIEDLYHAYGCGMVYNELNADKGMFAKELRKDGLTVSTYSEAMNKHVKITSYLKYDWLKVHFVLGTDEEYINQICDYNEEAEHDDCPDSLASLMRALWKRMHKVENNSAFGY